MIRSIALGIAVVLSAATFAAAQSADEQSACKDDALRVCGDAIPDRDQVARCLNVKKDLISQACRTVIARYFPARSGPAKDRDQAAQERARAGRSQPDRQSVKHFSTSKPARAGGFSGAGTLRAALSN